MLYITKTLWGLLDFPLGLSCIYRWLNRTKLYGVLFIILSFSPTHYMVIFLFTVYLSIYFLSLTLGIYLWWLRHIMVGAIYFSPPTSLSLFPSFSFPFLRFLEAKSLYVKNLWVKNKDKCENINKNAYVNILGPFHFVEYKKL